MAPQTIAERYHVERSIGRGGMGTVWLARDERLHRNVAVKQIGTLPGEAAPDLARAMREARSSAVLSHPNVVSIYDVVEENDCIWLVMEYVASRTLGQMITQDGPLSPETAVGIGAQIADGLAAAHAAGTIHRDVKPGNILVTTDQVAKISDFGIARAHDQGQLTRSGLVIGTPEYFSPELARGEKPTPAVDVWALGATLYAAVEGHPPFPHQSNALALLAVIASTPPPRPESAGFLTGPIGRMLDPNPDARWSMNDAAHVLQRLDQQHARDRTRQSTSELPAKRAVITAASPVAAPVSSAAAAPPDDPPSGAADLPPDERSPRPIGGRLLLAGLAGLLALAAVSGFLLLHGGSADRPSTAAQDPPSVTDRTGNSTGNRSTGNRDTTPSPGSGNVTPKQPKTLPTTSPPRARSSDETQVRNRRSVTGASAQQFVRDYYSALPSDTASAWSALSPGFQDKIGGYGNYQGFWSRISSVTVRRTAAVGSRAVDVSLTYTTDQGRVDSEVRRIYVEQHGADYLIDDDAIVG